MGIVSGARIVEDGLIFHYDMDNVEKSWEGPPTTNNAANGKVDYYSRWAKTTSHPDLPFSKKTDVYVLTNGNNYFGSSGNFSITNGNTYTVSYWYYIDTVQDMQHFMRPLNSSYGSVGSVSTSTFVQTNNTSAESGNINGWLWGYQTFTVTAAPTYMRGTYTVGGGDTTPTGSMYITNVVIEPGSTPSGPYGYTGGTRSNTEAIVDLTGNSTITANSLTYNNDGTFKFNGTSDYMNAGSIPELNGSSTISLDAWVKVDNLATTDRKIICYKRDADTNANFQLRRGYNTDGLYYQWHNSAWKTFYIDNFFSNTTDWHHVSIVHNPSASNQVVCYKNGEEFTDTFGADSTALNWQAATLFIGYRTAAEYFDGNISNVKIYNRALSAAEVKQNFEASRSRYGV